LSPLFRPVSSWRANEVISLWLGSLFGAALGLGAGLISAVLYVDAFPTDEPLEDLYVAILFTPVGGFIGAVIVVWIALHVIHAPRAGVSALVCGLLLAALAPLTAGIGAILIPFNIGIGLHSAFLVGTIASLLSAVVTYLFVTSRGEAKHPSEPS